MFTAIHTTGEADDDPPWHTLSDLYDELVDADQEHGDVAVIHEDTGWCMSAHRDGRLVFEHLGGGGARHLTPVAKARVLEYWRRLIAGEIEQLLAEPWRAGYQE